MNILYDYDPETALGAVPSPCLSICTMDLSKDVCSGCFRSIEEITLWSTASDQTKRNIWRQIKQRMFD